MKDMDSYFKNRKKKTNRAGGITQVVEHLLSKCKALSSNCITAKTNKQNTPKTNTLSV
jgi:hypothetical protein